MSDLPEAAVQIVAEALDAFMVHYLRDYAMRQAIVGKWAEAIVAALGLVEERRQYLDWLPKDGHYRPWMMRFVTSWRDTEPIEGAVSRSGHSGTGDTASENQTP